MPEVVRLALLLVIFVLLGSIVVGLVAGETGILEKLVLLAVGVLLIVTAGRLRRLRPGPRPPH
jgi:hypothetical protein